MNSQPNTLAPTVRHPGSNVGIVALIFTILFLAGIRCCRLGMTEKTNKSQTMRCIGRVISTVRVRDPVRGTDGFS
jgi:hypothetical protein